MVSRVKVILGMIFLFVGFNVSAIGKSESEMVQGTSGKKLDVHMLSSVVRNSKKVKKQSMVALQGKRRGGSKRFGSCRVGVPTKGNKIDRSAENLILAVKEMDGFDNNRAVKALAQDVTLVDGQDKVSHEIDNKDKKKKTGSLKSKLVKKGIKRYVAGRVAKKRLRSALVGKCGRWIQKQGLAPVAGLHTTKNTFSNSLVLDTVPWPVHISDIAWSGIKAEICSGAKKEVCEAAITRSRMDIPEVDVEKEKTKKAVDRQRLKDARARFVRHNFDREKVKFGKNKERILGKKIKSIGEAGVLTSPYFDKDIVAESESSIIEDGNQQIVSESHKRAVTWSVSADSGMIEPIGVTAESHESVIQTVEELEETGNQDVEDGVASHEEDAKAVIQEDTLGHDDDSEDINSGDVEVDTKEQDDEDVDFEDTDFENVEEVVGPDAHDVESGATEFQEAAPLTSKPVAIQKAGVIATVKATLAGVWGWAKSFIAG